MHDLNTLAQAVNGDRDILLSLVGSKEDYEYLLSADYSLDRSITRSIYERSVIFTVGDYDDTALDRANMAYLRENFNNDGEIWVRYCISYTNTVIITVLDMDRQPTDTLDTLLMILDEVTMGDGCLDSDKQSELELADFTERVESDCRSYLYTMDNVWLEEKRLAQYAMTRVWSHDHGTQLSNSELSQCIEQAYDLCVRFRLVTPLMRRKHMGYYYRIEVLQSRFISTRY